MGATRIGLAILAHAPSAPAQTRAASETSLIIAYLRPYWCSAVWRALLRRGGNHAAIAHADFLHSVALAFQISNLPGVIESSERTDRQKQQCQSNRINAPYLTLRPLGGRQLRLHACAFGVELRARQANKRYIVRRARRDFVGRGRTPRQARQSARHPLSHLEHLIEIASP
jgi:hypothetical protein